MALKTILVSDLLKEEVLHFQHYIDVLSFVARKDIFCDTYFTLLYFYFPDFLCLHVVEISVFLTVFLIVFRNCAEAMRCGRIDSELQRLIIVYLQFV